MSIADTLKDAADAAAKSTNTAVVESTPASVPATVAPGKRLSLTDTRNNAGSSVATFLKVSFYGLTIGKDAKKLLKSFEATIDLSEAKACIQTRYGNPAQYFKTYDGAITSGSGKPWTQTLAQAKQMDPSKSSDPFNTAELVVVADEDIKTADGLDVVPAGTRIGYTPPYTGVDAFTKLMKAVEEAGGDQEKSKVRITVGFEPQSRGGNNWGIVTFQFKSLIA